MKKLDFRQFFKKSEKPKKSTRIDWTALLINAIVDLLVGVILILIGIAIAKNIKIDSFLHTKYTPPEQICQEVQLANSELLLTDFKYW